MMKPACLFITYDGLLDPLGQSQILPYLRGIAKHPRSVFILSFEKPEKFYQQAGSLILELQQEGLIWKPLLFTRRFSHLGKAWDLCRMYVCASWMILRHNIPIVHARGHISAQVGRFCKRLFSSRLLFDCRGFWVDEKVDKGSWDLNRHWHRWFYHYFKKQEKKLMRDADEIVVLTHAVLPELEHLGVSSLDKVNVIPCCADFDHFKPLERSQKNNIRQQLKIPEDAFLVGYVGSIGKMYRMDMFFEYFLKISQFEQNSYALLITPDVSLALENMQYHLPKANHHKVVCLSATRKEIPSLISLMQVMLSFIQPSYARLATSPTKIAESLACGVPVIANEGIGDVSEILLGLDVGYMIKDEENIPGLLKILKAKDPLMVRHQAQKLLDLPRAHQIYQKIYQKLQKEDIC